MCTALHAERVEGQGEGVGAAVPVLNPWDGVSLFRVCAVGMLGASSCGGLTSMGNPLQLVFLAEQA